VTRGALTATIDIDPDTLNLKSHGKWITAYVELPAGFDVADIDVSTVAIIKVNGRALRHPIRARAHPARIGDDDRDGVPDLKVKFARAAVQAVVPVAPHVVLTVEGRLSTGQALEGSDTIRVIRRGAHGSDDGDSDDHDDDHDHDDRHDNRNHHGERDHDDSKDGKDNGRKK
jgi:hypothetical protein